MSDKKLVYESFKELTTEEVAFGLCSPKEPYINNYDHRY